MLYNFPVTKLGPACATPHLFDDIPPGRLFLFSGFFTLTHLRDILADNNIALLVHLYLTTLCNACRHTWLRREWGVAR